MNRFSMFIIALAITSSQWALAGLFGGEQPDSHGTFRLGIQSYSKTDGAAKFNGSATVMNYEYSRYSRYNQALILGFRQATDAKTQRDASHAAYGGWRFFPMGVGFPLLVSTGDATISYDAKYKPYAETSLGMGRALLTTVSEEGGGEFASDTLTFAFGGGVMMHFFTRWAVDFQFMYEILQGRGGTDKSVAISGTQVYILIGNGVLF